MRMPVPSANDFLVFLKQCKNHRGQVGHRHQTWALPLRRGAGRTPRSTGCFSVSRTAFISFISLAMHTVKATLTSHYRDLGGDLLIVLNFFICARAKKIKMCFSFPQKTLQANTSLHFMTSPSMQMKQRWASFVRAKARDVQDFLYQHYNVFCHFVCSGGQMLDSLSARGLL